MTDLHARPARLGDATTIAEIYNEGIDDRIATFETEHRTANDISGWFETRFPVVVITRNDQVIAFAATSTYRPRQCYAGIAEFSVYVARSARGIGAGRAAMIELMNAANDAGFWKLVSRVFPSNIASRNLLRSLGFREVGIYERHGQLDGEWLDVVIVERLLGNDDDPKPARMNEQTRSLGFITGPAPLSGWDGAWRPDPESVVRLAALEVGASIAVVKRAPDGSETTRYTGLVGRTRSPLPWIEVEATWTHGAVTVSGLAFEPGDALREFFSPAHPFNAFALHSPSGAFKGWYGNVTFPAFVTSDVASPTLVWHDLYLDVVILPDGSMSLLDDDELALSGLPQAHPRFARAIEAARRDLLESISGFVHDR